MNNTVRLLDADFQGNEAADSLAREEPSQIPPSPEPASSIAKRSVIYLPIEWLRQPYLDYWDFEQDMRHCAIRLCWSETY